ncbi:MAG TPA: XrtA system polysaccharide deacetylase [Gemmatimonadales bacterium]|nr:XrtA system polysaccharide deacetylase [Gemmatimonadales bacterium]
MIRHYFTVDVEEHFQVLSLAPWVARERWDSLESRVSRNVDRLLQLLADHGATGTFFTLGWVAERQPAMVKAIAAAGHEVASHGYDHRRVVELSPEAFRDQVRRTKAILEALSGQPCLGYRAPNYSIVAGREWALDILVEEGYRYDSSLFPITRPGYGYAGGGRDPYWLDRPAGKLFEVPPTTLRRAGLNLPAAGGAYFRLLPPVLVRSALRDAERRGQPGTFYLHPWEIDPGQPRFDVPLLTRVRHYGGLAGTWRRLERLMREFRFVSVAEGMRAAGAAAA